MAQIQYDTDIYTLQLHEATFIRDCYMSVTRVPGGWIYTKYVNREGCPKAKGSAFVPFNNEFQPTSRGPLRSV